jgi:hypothetical protein
VDGGATATDSRFTPSTRTGAWPKAEVSTSRLLRHEDHAAVPMMMVRMVIAIIIIVVAIVRVPPVVAARMIITASVGMGAGSGSQCNAQHGDS